MVGNRSEMTLDFHLDQFSTRNVKYESMLKDFDDFGSFCCSPAWPDWVRTQSELGFGRLKPNRNWGLANQNPIGIGCWPAKAQSRLGFGQPKPNSDGVRTQSGHAGLQQKLPT